MHDDGSAPRVPAPLANWRRAAEDQRIDAVPAHLRERLATTPNRSPPPSPSPPRSAPGWPAAAVPRPTTNRSRAAWNRLVADFERRQAAALRSGRLLATPWRPVPDARDHRRRP